MAAFFRPFPGQRSSLTGILVTWSVTLSSATRRVRSVLTSCLRDPASLRARYLLLNERKGLLSALRPAHLAEEGPERLIVEPEVRQELLYPRE